MVEYAAQLLFWGVKLDSFCSFCLLCVKYVAADFKSLLYQLLHFYAGY